MPPADGDAFFSAAFWQAVAPGLHVCDPAFARAVAASRIDAAELDRLPDDITRRGWSRFRPAAWNVDPHALASAVEQLEKADLPAVFLFAFDEAWLLFAGLRPALARLLGDGYRALPDFWVWHVSPKDGQAGWAPHRDRGAKSLLPGGAPASMTLWVALSDATPDNGCIYLVPADRDPTYGTAQEDEHRFALADIRALPATAGTVLCWNQAILHWGARASDGDGGPRISMALEFQRGDVEPFNRPLLPPDVFPDLKARLTLIGKQLVQYSHMYPPGPAVKAFLGRLMGR